MKKMSILAALAALALCSCAKQEEAAVSVPDVLVPAEGCSLICAQTAGPEAGQDGTKVLLNDDQNSSFLSWERSDCLTLISADGEQTERYAIRSYGSTRSIFEGNTMKAGAVSILVPGQTYTTVSALRSRNYAGQSQSGNGSTAHLQYNAWMTGVSDYGTVTFSSEWAAAHGGQLWQNGCVKFVFTLPSSMEGHSVSALSVKAPQATFKNTLDGSKVAAMALTLSNVTIGSDKNLTAYIMFPAEDVSVPDGSLTLSLVVDNKYMLVKTITASNMVLKAGKVNVLNINDKNWKLLDMETQQEVKAAITVDGTAAKGEWTLPIPGIVNVSVPVSARWGDLYNFSAYADKGWLFLKMEFLMPYWNYSLPFDLMIDIDGNPATGAYVMANATPNGDNQKLWSNMGIEWYLECPGLSNGVNNFYDWTCVEGTGADQMGWYKYLGTNGADIFSGGLERKYYPNELWPAYMMAKGTLDSSAQKAVLEARLRRFSLEARNTSASVCRIGLKLMATHDGEALGWNTHGLLPQGAYQNGQRQLVDMAEIPLPPYDDYEIN